VAANPDEAQASNNLAYLLAEHGGNLDEALKYAQKAVELTPDSPAYADTLGWILYRKGVYASAVRYLETAAKAQKLTVAKYHLAMAYARTSDWSRGRSTLNAALRLDPSLPEAATAQQLFAREH
jgi:Flp pilus assembly protein TadD